MAKDKATVLSGGIALQASGLPDIASGEVPEWIHILPASTVHTADGCGPYTVKDFEAARVAMTGLLGDHGRPLGMALALRRAKFRWMILARTSSRFFKRTRHWWWRWRARHH